MSNSEPDEQMRKISELRSKIDREGGPKKPVIGELCFFKRLRAGLGSGDHFVEIKGGHAFGILLGTVLDGQAVPPPQLLSALMSYHGWVTFDDVLALLGKPACDELLAKVQTKYFNVPPEASKAIVDRVGKPVAPTPPAP